MSSIQSQLQKKDGIFLTHPPSISPLFSHLSSSSPNSNYPKESTQISSSGSSKLSPAIIFIIVIIGAIFLISSLLHLVVKFLSRHSSSSSSSSISQSNRYTEFNSGSDVLQRQLQQLFHLHDSGLDQAFIDQLPVFLYKEIMGSISEAFDCAVCLCEFSEEDKLRLLPLCSHAFHIDCIDKWLLSNSTCPLCRGTLFTPGLPPIHNPTFVFDDSREEIEVQDDNNENGVSMEIEETRRVFPVKLGKFRNVNNGGGERKEEEEEEGESSSNNLDARRCYSMGSLKYVVGESNLQVALSHDKDGNDKDSMKGQNGYSLFNGDLEEGKKLNNRSKGESFSVSKIWLWPKKDNFPTSSNKFVP